MQQFFLKRPRHSCLNFLLFLTLQYLFRRLWVFDRLERCFHLLFLTTTPFEIFQPNVCLQLNAVVQTESRLWSSGNALVNKISSLETPTLRRINFLKQFLFIQNLFFVADSVRPDIRLASSHHFVNNYSQPEKVACVRVILPQQHFGRHVARCAACVSRVVLAADSCEPEIDYRQVSILTKDYVLRPDVSVDHAI